MEGLAAILMVFGTPVLYVFIKNYYRFREKQLAFEGSGDKKQLAASTEEKKRLEARIANLESIVCSVDFELNQRMNRLLAEQSQALRLSAAEQLALAGAAGAGTGTGGAAADPPAGRPAPPAGATTADPRRAAAEPARADNRDRSAAAFGVLPAGSVVLGRYTVERELGRGGMGAVYLANDSRLSERVALKTISSLLCADPDEMADRFRREVQAARKVTHPNVIRIHDLGEDGPLLFLSMEYVDGETLAARVRRLGPLPIPEAVEILVAVADGVAAAHAAGIVHRDLKPQNVLLAGKSNARVVKVIDFGLAKTSFAEGMTATGMILGTPEYMAPEQIRGHRSDARTDVYALGAMGYFVLCGRPPFAGETPIAIGFAQVTEAPRPPRELRPEIPRPLEATLLRALAKDPADRFVDAAAFKTALAAS